MRTYDTYKDSGISWLGQIPSHWDVKRLGSYFTERRQKVSDKDYEPLSVTKQGIFPQLENVAKTNDGDNRKLVRKGDFVINSRSDRKGSSGVSELDGSVSLINIVLEPHQSIIPAFCNFLLKSHGFIEEYYRIGRGIVADLWTTRYQEMKFMPLAVPPLAEQEAIVAYLDGATAEIDKAIASQQRMVELLQERKQIIINQAVTQGLNPDAPMKPTNIDWLPQIPAHWDIKMFKHLYRTRTGITFTKAQLEDKGERVISYGQIHSKLNWYSSVNPELIRYIPESLTSGCDGALAYKGDFLFADTSEDFEGCGNCIYVDTEEPIYAGYHTILAKKNNEEHGEYLAFLFASTNWRGQVRSAVNGVKVYSITQTILNNTSVILPPVNEQKQIADYIQSAIKPIDAEITRCQHKVELLTERKQILINDVVTGKIKVSYYDY